MFSKDQRKERKHCSGFRFYAGNFHKGYRIREKLDTVPLLRVGRQAVGKKMGL